ncbi:DNA polymerase [Caproicibacterium argilliputei]|uniref:DNA-directed DNA polymerase n=1 Tax=Caproicibacterium argilliputei TaxID=3030016 RepID=A0AA97D9F1_9FIRM|nr:DNA polymerase [Caproicibacterium argilliputei]WOC33035.1 DNA polymerase [Caproicibacterium argilliputei]
MHDLNIDLETRSSEPIGKTGLYKYAQSPDFDILLAGYSIDGGPVTVVDLTDKNQLPKFADLMRMIQSPEYIKHAFNAAFEWYCLSRYTGYTLDPAEWRDTMLQTLYCGYPASLDAAGKAMGLPQDKRKLQTGKALIKTFCTPHKQTDKDRRPWINPADEPEKWKLFVEYNRQDVVTEVTIGQMLRNFPVPDDVQKQWVQDLQINARGVALDLDLISGALAANDKVMQPLIAEAQRLTGLDNPNSMAQVKGWMQKRGYKIDTLRKADVEDLLNGDTLDPTTRRALEIRQETGKTSVTKYTAMRQAVCEDGRIRGTLQFYGANRTGRWAGRLVQVQNLPRTYIHPPVLDCARELTKAAKAGSIELMFGTVPDTLSQLVRTAFIPAPGNKFIDADSSAIEARVIAWLAKEQWVLDVFKTHGKIYEAQASQMFGVPIDRIKKGNPEYALRQKGKVATLALGYQGSAGALINMGAIKMGIPEEDLPEIVQRWRQSNRRIVDLWHKVEQAAIETVSTGKQTAAQCLLFSRECDKYNDFLTIQLPSKRKLYYSHPQLSQDDMGRQRLQYWGQNQTTHQWQLTDTYGGKLVENCVQAIARDCLAINIDRLESAGYKVVFHIHDEVVIDASQDQHLDDVINIMRTPISWARGLPLNADGWEGNYFTKD